MMSSSEDIISFDHNTDTTTIIVQIILGIIISIIIYFSFGFNIKYRGPNSRIIRRQLYKYDGKCYMFQPVIHICR